MPEPTPPLPTGPDDSVEHLGPDSAIRGALGVHFGEAPADAVDWSALEARVTDAARFRLAQRSNRGGWRIAAERWGRVAIPAGLAAAVLLATGLAMTAPSAGDDGSLAMDEVVAVAASDALPLDALAPDQDGFLAAVLDPVE